MQPSQVRDGSVHAAGRGSLASHGAEYAMPNLLDLLAAPKQEGRKISEGDQKSSGRGGASVLQNSHFFQFPPISCHPAVVGLIGVKPKPASKLLVLTALAIIMGSPI